MIYFKVEELGNSDISEYDYDWELVYTSFHKDISSNAPGALGNFVTIIQYVNANLMQDIFTGCSVIGILHLLSQTPIDWYFKKQITIENASHGL